MMGKKIASRSRFDFSARGGKLGHIRLSFLVDSRSTFQSGDTIFTKLHLESA